VDINTISTDWVSVNALSGIAVGSPMEMQNKNSNLLTFQEKATKPATEDYSGRLVRYCEVYEAWAGSSEIWVRGATSSIFVNVQAVPS
jgi:hypothetical protein